MIQSFRCVETEKIFQGLRSTKLPSDIQQVARRKLIAIDQAMLLTDLRIPSGNNLEALAGDRKGQHSIRINKQWRICFVWGQQGSAQVEIVDYH